MVVPGADGFFSLSMAVSAVLDFHIRRAIIKEALWQSMFPK